MVEAGVCIYASTSKVRISAEMPNQMCIPNHGYSSRGALDSLARCDRAGRMGGASRTPLQRSAGMRSKDGGMPGGHACFARVRISALRARCAHWRREGRIAMQKSMSPNVGISRRSFLAMSGLVGAGVALSSAPVAQAQEEAVEGAIMACSAADEASKLDFDTVTWGACHVNCGSRCPLSAGSPPAAAVCCCPAGTAP